jgi:hypothetical protein
LCGQLLYLIGIYLSLEFSAQMANQGNAVDTEANTMRITITGVIPQNKFKNDQDMKEFARNIEAAHHGQFTPVHSAWEAWGHMVQSSTESVEKRCFSTGCPPPPCVPHCFMDRPAS